MEGGPCLDRLADAGIGTIRVLTCAPARVALPRTGEAGSIKPVTVSGLFINARHGQAGSTNTHHGQARPTKHRHG